MKKVKIVIFVPSSHADTIRQAMGDAGAGVIGNYTHCTFSTKGIGNYLPGEVARPFIGSVGKFESVEEERIEMVCNREKAKKVIEEMKKTHPYEEVAFDIYPLILEEEL